MGVLDTVRGRDGRDNAAQTETDVYEKQGTTAASGVKDGDQQYALNADPETRSLEAREDKEVSAHPGSITEGTYAGLQKAEAVALVWSRKAVFGTYAWIWVCFFMLAFHQTMTNLLNPYVYSDFQKAPQLPTAYMLANIIGGVMKLPLGKTLNLWGRAEGLMFSLAIYLLGMIILAACTGPNSFAAGYTLYWIGYYCLYLLMDVFVADTSGLRNRAFAFAFIQTPFICTAFTSSLAASSVLNTAGWRWGYGIFAIVQFFVFIPLAIIFKYYEKKAEKMGIYYRQPSGRTTVQSIVHYMHEFDVVGALLIMAAFVLFLLPFSLVSYGRSAYDTPTFIVLLVVGFCLFFVFAAWEKWFARTHFIRWELFKKRTILGACALALILFFSFELWDFYFQNFFRVVYNVDITDAGYMLQIYNVGSTFWAIPVGIFIRQTRHFKPICLYFGVPVMLLGSGLMIYFRGQEHGIGYVVMCAIFIAFGGGTLVIGEDMAVMSGGDREGIPMMLAMIGLFSNIGGAIGLAVTAAIYNNVWVDALQRHLPDDMKSQAMQISIDGLETQMKYAPGTPIRDALVYAWSWTQRANCIASTCVLILAIPAVAVWKNYNVDRKQNKGTVL
ncbi:hypothetical protein N7474_003173 [Penicillium riverlandense]|uniref:uncharacterized protein n=1 Tax=Penicillium riverlandense TaxID=1903569 RepID=UPI002549280B|nr:uncharacterized protein N7474_003173 [Penicillium riverlandense]KAJ5826035.1 hypothetical protein N7474_003173 [Penicillium riverlandense]